jgi:hypothetical protein
MFGIGPLELLILSATALFLLGIPVAIIALLVMLVRKQRSNGELNVQLRKENELLRQELSSEKTEDC